MTEPTLHGDSDTAANEGRGRRCVCGHYATEHEDSGCRGAYGTLMADADDYESVEVHCPCDRFAATEPGWHEVRSR